jgi:hypothetical protein
MDREGEVEGGWQMPCHKSRTDIPSRCRTQVGTEGAALTSIYIATAVMSEILTNNAAGAIMYPVRAAGGRSRGVRGGRGRGR